MSEKRVWLLLSFIFLINFVFAGRLFFLQIIKGRFYRALAQGQSESLRAGEGSRGEIFFSNGKKLAANKEEILVRFSLSAVFAEEKLKQSLEEILQTDFGEFSEEKTFRREITEQQEEALKLLDSPLLQIEKGEGRFYPQGELAAQVIGFVGGNNQGQYGLEEKYEAELRGQPGLFRWEHSPFGFLISGAEDLSAPQSGKDLVLTLDYNIQFESRRLLQEAKDRWEIDGGSIIVMDPSTGAILSLASLPSFDPGNYSKSSLENFLNPVTQKIFEPGSVFKAFTMAAGLNEGKVNPLTTYEDKGYIEVGGPPIYNYENKVYGECDMTEVLKHSVNTGAVFVERQLGSELFWKYVERFGFTQPTGIDLAEEVSSSNLVLRNGIPRDFATASFGQSVVLTPIQLVTGFSAIANNGEMVQPYLVSKIIDSQGEERSFWPQTKKVVSPKTASQLTTMLVEVVESGYGKRARIEGYQIAGKTGTAQVLLPGQTAYDSEQTIQSFIGFAPALDPQFLALVKLDNPKVASSYYSAAPLFQELAQFIIHYYQIPPSLQPEAMVK